VPDETKVTPSNLQRTITNPSISSELRPSPPELTATPGYRAAEAFVRPTPTFVAGKVTQYGFDLKKCEFILKLKASAPAKEDAPTIVFLPDFHFPRDLSIVEASSGKWEIITDDEEGVMLQRLKWWHGEGDQSLKINGLVREHNVLEGTAEEMGYLQQCQQGYGWNIQNCSIM
jgi:hypothetical protein